MRGVTTSVLSVQATLSLGLSLLVEPFESALRSKLCRVVLLLLGGYIFAVAVADFVLLGGYGVVTFAAYRFVPLTPLNVTLVTNFTLLFQGCPVRQYYLARPLRTSSAAADGADPRAFGVSFPSPVAMDGFVLTLAAAAAAAGAGPGPFRLEGSSDGGETWAAVGTPTFRQTRRGVRLLPGGGGGGGTRTAFDFRPPWPLAVGCCEEGA